MGVEGPLERGPGPLSVSEVRSSYGQSCLPLVLVSLARAETLSPGPPSQLAQGHLFLMCGWLRLVALSPFGPLFYFAQGHFLVWGRLSLRGVASHSDLLFYCTFGIPSEGFGYPVRPRLANRECYDSGDCASVSGVSECGRTSVRPCGRAAMRAYVRAGVWVCG